jgi:dihydroneopterin aldolase
MMKTKIHLEKMRFHAFHGLLPHEMTAGNEFEVSVLLEADVAAACESDNVEDTIDYSEIFMAVKAEMEIRSLLIEHVAGRILRRILKHYAPLTFAEVRVAKLRPPVGGEMDRAEVILSSGAKS